MTSLQTVAIWMMDQSSNGGDNAKTSSVVQDRPPRSPVRTPSRKLPFTRSRAFPSIKRRTNPETNRLWLTLYTIRVIWLVALFCFLYSYWRSAKRLIWSNSQVAPVRLSHFPSIFEARFQKQPTRSRRTESAPSPEIKHERVKILLGILHESKSKSRQWPSILKLHRIPSRMGERSPTKMTGTTSSCIVTAYFQTDSKHDERQYDLWMQNMLSMHDCMVIFCEFDMVERIKKYRSHSPRPTAIIEVPLEDLPISSYFYDSPTTPTAADFWQHQFEIDPEKAIHRGYKVFWIWLSKSWFVSTAALLQQHLFAISDDSIDSLSIDIWMWADIGSFRDKRFSNETLLQHANFVELFPDPMSVLWMAHRKPNPPPDPFWNRKLLQKEKSHFFHSGSQAIAASVQAWITFHEYFVNTLDDYAARELFLGEDQCVLQTTCLLHPESCSYIPYDQVHDNKYFGLRHVVRFGPNNGKRWNLRPFRLWRPPILNHL
jgi:hypothetical protein